MAANCTAYVAGAALSITATITNAYFVSTGATGQGSSDDTLYIVVIVLLVFAAIHTFLTRKTAEPPKWMGELQAASPKTSLGSGSCFSACSRETSSPGAPDPNAIGLANTPRRR